MGTIYVDFCNNFFNMSRRKKSYLAKMGHCKVSNQVHQATNARLVVRNTIQYFFHMEEFLKGFYTGINSVFCFKLIGMK